MKRIFFEKAYMPFVLAGLMAVSIAVFLRGAHPESYFDITLYSTDFTMANSRIWFIFSGYLFSLAAIYYFIAMKNLKTKRWMVISHYVFIVSFMVFFMIFSAFGNPGVRALTEKLPLSLLISVYGFVFLTDLLLFVGGVLLLIINLFSLSKK